VAIRSTRMGYGQRCSAWVSSVGRSFESVRMGVKDASVRWAKASRTLKKDLWAEAGRDGQEAHHRGFLCLGRSFGGNGIFNAQWSSRG